MSERSDGRPCTVEEHEAKLAALREALDASIREGGAFSDAEVEDAIAIKATEVVEQGY